MNTIIKNKDMGISYETVEGHEIADVELINRVMKKLTDEFPGYRWRVGINDESLGGILYIQCLDVNVAVFGNKNYGYVLKLSKVYTDPDLSCVMRAGGEILERANLARKWNPGDEPTHIDGIPDHHQPIPGITIDGDDSKTNKDPKYLTTDEASKYLEKFKMFISSDKLKLFRIQGDGPIFKKVDGKIRYSEDDLDLYGALSGLITLGSMANA